MVLMIYVHAALRPLIQQTYSQSVGATASSSGGFRARWGQSERSSWIVYLLRNSLTLSLIHPFIPNQLVFHPGLCLNTTSEGKINVMEAKVRACVRVLWLLMPGFMISAAVTFTSPGSK